MTASLLPAARMPHAERAALWNEAFSDYYAPGSLTAESLQAFERTCDLDLEASRIVMDEGVPVAFGMLGIRGSLGWVGGMGVVPSARRRGHGRRVMVTLLETARERRLQAVSLEVLVQNDPAIPLYESLGFRTTRLLEVWERAADAPAAGPGVPARPLPMAEAADLAARWRLDRVPWQRELGSMRAVFPDLQALVADQPDAPRAGEPGGGGALAIFRAGPERVGLVELVASPGAGGAARDRALESLLATILATFPARPARLLNLPEGDPAGAALARAGTVVSHRQWEMEIGV
jgi:ribosomal protein S18 acetylase RimI-like enzyme